MIPGKRVILSAFVALLVAACAPEHGDTDAEEVVAPPPDSTPTVVFETTMGRFVMELDQRAAPATVTSFLLHVNQQFYKDIIIHRVRQNFMVQMGLLTENYERRLSPVAYLQNEGDNGLLNVRGAVSMARGADPHTAKTEFFVNVKDNHQDGVLRQCEGQSTARYERRCVGLLCIRASDRGHGCYRSDQASAC